jgi:hypothetical protein
MTADNQAVVDHSLAERRRYRRERVALAGRQFEPAESREAPCQIADLSPGGAHILSDVVPPPGTRLVVYIEGFGRFEGSIARSDEGGFGIEFDCSALKRERVAEQLTLYMNGAPLEETALRHHNRTPTKRMASFTRANGDVVHCKMLDFSHSGVFLATEVRPPVGEIVLISEMAGRVTRHHDMGLAIEFLSQEKPAVESTRPRLFAAG